MFESMGFTNVMKRYEYCMDDVEKFHCLAWLEWAPLEMVDSFIDLASWRFWCLWPDSTIDL
jgi:hypothetical protein